MARTQAASRKANIATQNLLLWSEDISNASWTKTAITATAGAATDPLGTSNASLLVPNTSNTNHQVLQNVANLTSGNVVCYSFYAKPAGYDYLLLRVGNGMGAIINAYFNVTAGTLGTTGTGVTSSITSAGSGWYLCTMFTAFSGLTSVRINVSNADNVTNFAGDGVSGIYVFGGSLNFGNRRSTYQKTTSSQLNPTLNFRGLLTNRAVKSGRVLVH